MNTQTHKHTYIYTYIYIYIYIYASAYKLSLSLSLSLSFTHAHTRVRNVFQSVSFIKKIRFALRLNNLLIHLFLLLDYFFISHISLFSKIQLYTWKSEKNQLFLSFIIDSSLFMKCCSSLVHQISYHTYLHSIVHSL